MRRKREGRRRKITPVAALRARIASTRAAGGFLRLRSAMEIGRRPPARHSSNPVWLAPFEAVHRRAAGAVLGADPALPAHRVDGVEDDREIEFALVRRQPRRRTGELHVSDQRAMLLPAPWPGALPP